MHIYSRLFFLNSKLGKIIVHVSTQLVHNFSKLGSVINELLSLHIDEFLGIFLEHFVLIVVTLFIKLCVITKDLEPTNLIALEGLNCSIVLFLQSLIHFPNELSFLLGNFHYAVYIIIVLWAFCLLILFIDLRKLFAHLFDAHTIIIHTFG